MAAIDNVSTTVLEIYTVAVDERTCGRSGTAYADGVPIASQNQVTEAKRKQGLTLDQVLGEQRRYIRSMSRGCTKGNTSYRDGSSKGLPLPAGLQGPSSAA